jgi:hypothetical protein
MAAKRMENIIGGLKNAKKEMEKLEEDEDA